MPRLGQTNATMTETTNSYAMIIRDGILERLKVLPYFKDFKFARSKQMQVQPTWLPYVGAYLIDETMTPDGEYNVGDIRFRHALRLGFSVVIKNNDPDETEDKLDAGFWAIMNGIMRDPSLVNLIESGLPSNARIEGFSRGMRKHNYHPAQGHELPIGELQLDLTCGFRVDWPPLVLDDLLKVHVTTAFPLGATEADRAKVQQVVSEYDLPPTE